MLSGDVKGKLFIEMSTVRPAVPQEMSAKVKAKGAAFVECPVGGTTGPASEGKLFGFAGGEPADVERAMPILKQMCRRVEHVGPAGAGARMKLAINLPLLVYWQSLGEALSLVRDLKIEPARLMDILADTSGAASMMKNRAPVGRRRARRQGAERHLEHRHHEEGPLRDGRRSARARLGGADHRARARMLRPRLAPGPRREGLRDAAGQLEREAATPLNFVPSTRLFSAYSGLMPMSAISLRKRGMSWRTSCSNSSPLEAAGSRPAAFSRSARSGCASARVISACSRCTIGRGVAGGQGEGEIGRRHGVLAGARLGERRHSGRSGERFGELMASARRRPSRTKPSTRRGRCDGDAGIAGHHALHRRAGALVRDVHEIDGEPRLERLELSCAMLAMPKLA